MVPFSELSVNSYYPISITPEVRENVSSYHRYPQPPLPTTF